MLLLILDEIMIPVGEYFIGNYEAFGYYRVNYDTENWNRITQQLIDDHTVNADFYLDFSYFPCWVYFNATS